MSLQLNQKTTGFANLISSFQKGKRSEVLHQTEFQKTARDKKYFYYTIQDNQSVCLTPKQHQCLWLYHQHRNIKTVAMHAGISDRTTEEHLNFVREKFQMRKLKLLMNAVDNELIKFFDRK